MKIKQILSTAIAVSMLFSALPMTAWADNNEEPLALNTEQLEVTAESAEITTAEAAEPEEEPVQLEAVSDFQENVLTASSITAVSDGLINMLYETDYQDGTISDARQMGKTNMANATDPKSSSNKVLRLWAKEEATDPYGAYINARLGGTASIGDVWSNGKWGSTYEEVGALADVPLVYEMDLYLSNEIKSQLKSANNYNPALSFGPMMTTGNPGNKNLAYNIGIDTITSGAGFTGHGTADAWLGTDNWQKKCAISFDKWYKFMWVITGEGSNTKVSIFMSSDDGAAYTRLYNGVTAEKQYNRATTLMHGIKITSDKALAVGSEAAGVFVDNVKIYQVIEQEAVFEVADTSDVDMENGIVVDLKHTISPSKLSEAFTIEHNNEAVTKATVSAVDGEPSKVLISSDVLEGATDYTIYFEGYTFGTQYTKPNSIKITTKRPTSMKVNADKTENEVIPAGVNKILLSFSQNVTADAVEKALTLVDEDNIPQSFTVNQESERIIGVSMDLGELCGFTLKLDSSLSSDTDPSLPLEKEFTLNFRTDIETEASEDDPYDKPEHGDTKLVTTEDVSDVGKWWSSDPTTTAFTGVTNGAKIAVTNSEETVTVIPKATKSDDYYEASNKSYPHAAVMVFEYDIKLPDLTAATNLKTTISFSVTSDHANDEVWKNVGGWNPSFSMTYDENGLSAQKNSAASSKTKVYSADELVGKDTIHIKIKADVETGIISIIRDDGTAKTVDMNTSVQWGDSDLYMNWSPYMYIRNISFVCQAQRRETAEFEVSNMSVRRVTKTLGVEGASFTHGEYYVDTNNMVLTFNEEVEASELQKAVYITDENGDKAENYAITVTGSGRDFNIAVTGLEAYTRYNLNVEGLSAINERMMSEAFTRGFVTKKANNVFVDTKDANAVLDTHGNRLAKASEIDYTMVIKNDGGAVQDMIGAVAVYDKNDGLLAVKYQDVVVGNNSFNLTNIPAGAERIKVYAWTKNTSGAIESILHEPDTIKEENAKTEYTFTYKNSLPSFDSGVADSVNSVLYISGKTSADKGVYSILVLDGENTPLSDAESKTLALVYSNVGKTEDGNVFGETFGFDAPTGIYTAYVLTENGAVCQSLDYIVTSELVDEYIKPMAAGTIPQNMLYEKTKEYNAGIGIDFTQDFVSERDKALLEKRLYERRNLLTGPSAEEYMDQLMSNIEFAKAEIKYLNELQSISYEGLIEDKLKSGVIYTKIDFTNYNLLDGDKKSAVRSALVGKAFADGDELKTAFDTAVANPPSSNLNNPPVISSGFSGGGGGGSSTSITSNVLSPKPEVTADDVFTDMDNHEWAKEAVLYLAKRNIVNGVSKDKYNPSGFVTREQFAKMTVLASDAYSENASADFEDVDITEWYAVYVASAKKKGLINGISETEFGVGRNITRQDMAVIIYRALTESKYTFTSERKDFADMEDVADYAAEAVQVLGAEGIINGYEDNTFRPTQFVTRAEAAMLIKALEEGVN